MQTLINPARRRLFSRKPSTAKHLRLPWVKSEKIFINNCTQCNQCITACETQIITPDPNGFPRIDFSDGECTFCNKCIENCEQPLFVAPEHRINALSDNPQTTQGIQPWPATLTLDRSSERNGCLATNNIYCQSCADECEVNAIRFSYKKLDENGNEIISAIPQPTLDINDCTQCGACISNCPQDAINLTVSDYSYQRE